jgi:hypothetical protein
MKIFCILCQASRKGPDNVVEWEASVSKFVF